MIRCLFGHKWSNWKIEKRSVINPKYPTVKMSEEFQRRTCEKCGYTEEELL